MSAPAIRCGCTVTFDSNGFDPRIEQCPLHDAAFALGEGFYALAWSYHDVYHQDKGPFSGCAIAVCEKARIVLKAAGLLEPFEAARGSILDRFEATETPQ
jgi:hypothetical protein